MRHTAMRTKAENNSKPLPRRYSGIPLYGHVYPDELRAHVFSLKLTRFLNTNTSASHDVPLGSILSRFHCFDSFKAISIVLISQFSLRTFFIVAFTFIIFDCYIHYFQLTFLLTSSQCIDIIDTFSVYFYSVYNINSSHFLLYSHIRATFIIRQRLQTGKRKFICQVPLPFSRPENVFNIFLTVQCCFLWVSLKLSRVHVRLENLSSHAD